MGVQSEKIQLTIVASGSAAKKELADLTQQKVDLEQKVKNLNKSSKNYRAEQAKLKTELQQVNQRMRKVRGEIDLNSMSMRDLRNRARDLKRVMDNMNPDSAEWKRLNGDLGRVNGRMKELRGSTSALRGSWDNLKQGIKAGIAAYAGIQGIRALWNGATQSVQDYIGQAKAIKKVEQAIISTNGAAGYSLSQLRKEAERLQEDTLFGDETILNDATAQLLTFTNIAGTNFMRTQQVALDLSTVLDGDLKSASIQLGKALNDPVANLSALSRSGIQFSKAQKVLIKDLAESGRLAEAQSVILDELERQYGGQAKAAVEAGGALKQLNNLWGDLSENMGRMFTNMINNWMPELKSMVKWMLKLTDQEKASDSVRQLNREFNIQMETLQRGNLSAENRNKLIEEINTKYKDYLPNLITEKDNLQDLKKAQEEANTAFMNKINMMAAEEALQDVRQKQIENEVSALKLQNRLSREQIELEEAKEGSLKRAAASYQGVDHTLHAANQRVEHTKTLIKQNREESEKLAAEFDVVNQAAQKLGVSLGTNLNPNADDAKKTIKQAQEDLKDLAGISDMIGAGGADGTEGERGADITEDGMNQEYFQQKMEFYARLQEMRMTAREQELLEEELYWDEMIDLNKHYATGATDLEDRKRQALAAINAKWDKQDIENTKNTEETKQALKRETLQNVAQMSSQFLGFIGDYMEKGSAAHIATATTQVAIDSATSISSAIKGATEAASMKGPAAPFLILGYITSMIGTVMSAFTQVKGIMDSAKQAKVDTDVTVPAFKTGTKGSTVTPPGWKLVGEEGPELINTPGGEKVITAPDTASILSKYNASSMMPVPRFRVDTAALNRSVKQAIPGFANGTAGATNSFYNEMTSSGAGGSVLEQQMERLIAAVMEEKERPAVVSQRQIKDRDTDLSYIRNFSDIRN
jgi:predicted  nucleic acid-binding Zn-ribbon protein